MYLNSRFIAIGSRFYFTGPYYLWTTNRKKSLALTKTVSVLVICDFFQSSLIFLFRAAYTLNSKTVNDQAVQHAIEL